ncbi:glycosyltransferase [Flagellimonas sp.]|uniref:glycosyltransferase n=1 Tax=Flagellimonas sp. TaxID=2058762 RepID=UPI003B5B13D4
MMSKKRISVCMATFNGEKYIEEQLQSILPQLKSSDEVIVSDDGSTDSTIEIIKSLNDSRIKLFHNSFRNVILNFEFAIGRASGDIIFLSDQDDVWYGNKVEKTLELLERYDLLFTNLSVFSTTLEDSHDMYSPNKNHRGLHRNFIKNHCVGATLAFKAHLLKYALPFPRKIEMHDMWIFFISSFYGKTFYYNKPLVHYRRHGLNVSNTGGKTTNSLLRIIEIRISWVIYLIKRILKVTFGTKN